MDPRFMQKIFDQCVENERGCSVWTGFVNADGYGVVRIGKRKGKWKYKSVHRLIFEYEFNIHLTRNQFVFRKCGNKLCTELLHMWIGTRKDSTINSIANRTARFVQPEFRIERLDYWKSYRATSLREIAKKHQKIKFFEDEDAWKEFTNQKVRKARRYVEIAIERQHK